MRAVMEAQLSSTPILQVTKEERWGEGGEEDNEDEKEGGKEVAGESNKDRVGKERGENGTAEGVTSC